jgi:hypothetical protein
MHESANNPYRPYQPYRPLALLARGIPRLPLLISIVVLFAIIPPGTLSHGPDLCLWRHVLGVTACPACGTTRALVAFFHGQFGQAIAFNHNVVLTAPALLALIGSDLMIFLGRARARWRISPSRILSLGTGRLPGRAA